MTLLHIYPALTAQALALERALGILALERALGIAEVQARADRTDGVSDSAAVWDDLAAALRSALALLGAQIEHPVFNHEDESPDIYAAEFPVDEREREHLTSESYGSDDNSASPDEID